jgi:Arc/MetJ-type ribon-helix-helix transcriptional regulator
LNGRVRYRKIYSDKEIRKRSPEMGTAVKKSISLPPELAEEVEEIAREEGKPLSAVIQDALRLARKERNKKEFYRAQDYWSRKAKEKGILTRTTLTGT